MGKKRTSVKPYYKFGRLRPPEVWEHRQDVDSESVRPHTTTSTLNVFVCTELRGKGSSRTVGVILG